MYKLTKRREAKGLPILEAAYQSLITRGVFDMHVLVLNFGVILNS